MIEIRTVLQGYTFTAYLRDTGTTFEWATKAVPMHGYRPPTTIRLSPAVTNPHGGHMTHLRIYYPGACGLIINTAKPRLPPRFPPRGMRRKWAQGRVCYDPAASGLHQDGRGGKGPWEGLETPGQYQTAQGSGFKYKVPHPTDGRSAGNRWVTGRGRISGAVDARDLLLLPAGPPLQPPGGWCARARRHGVLTLNRF